MTIPSPCRLREFLSQPSTLEHRLFRHRLLSDISLQTAVWATLNPQVSETSLRCYVPGCGLRELGKQPQNAGIHLFPAGENTGCQELTQGPALCPTGVLPGSGLLLQSLLSAVSGRTASSLFLKLFPAAQLLTEGGQTMGVSCTPQSQSPDSRASLSLSPVATGKQFHSDFHSENVWRALVV